MVVIAWFGIALGTAKEERGRPINVCRAIPSGISMKFTSRPAVSCSQNQQFTDSLRADPAQDAFNTLLTRWLTVWKPYFVMYAPVAYDLVRVIGQLG